MVFTKWNILNLINFSFTENALYFLIHNILWSSLLIFPFLFKTLGTQFAPPNFILQLFQLKHYAISFYSDYFTINLFLLFNNCFINQFQIREFFVGFV